MVMQDSSRPEFELLSLIAQEAIMGIAVFSKATEKCLYLNRLGAEVLETGSYEGAEIPLKLEDLMGQPDRPGFARGFARTVLEHEGLYHDILIQKKNGLAFVTNTGVKHARLPGGEAVFILMFQDITIQKKLQRDIQAKQQEIQKAFTDLVEQNRQLKELDQAKDKFIALTSHELRTPLSAIVATAEVLVLKLYESPEQKEEFIKTIHEQGLHLMELVNDILDFAKIRAGKMDFCIEQLDLRSAIDSVKSNFDPMAAHSKVTLIVQSPDSPVLAYYDPLRMKEVVNNVISNAIKYNKKNGTVTLCLETAPNGNARIRCTDTGLGIPADKLGSVFNEFETVGHVSQHHKGTGLGMPISKKLCQSMGGDLTFESVEGSGTTFYIDLPVDKVLNEPMYNSRQDLWGDLAA
jgi:signal transduction histidine kinase